MDVNLLLGVSAFAKQEDQSFATAKPPVDIATIDGVDVAALAGAFYSLVDELMGGQADDAMPATGVPVASEADDRVATFDAVDEAADEDEPEWDEVPRNPLPQMWLVELEIINRAAGAPTDLPRRTAVPENPENNDQTQDAPEKPGQGNDSLGTMPGIAPLPVPDAASRPMVPAAPPTAETTSDVLPQTPTTDAPVDLGGEQPTRFNARTIGASNDRPNVETPPPAERWAKSVNKDVAKNVAKTAEPKPGQHLAPASGAAAPVKDAPIAQAVEGITESRHEDVPRSAFPVPRSGSGFKVQRSGVATPATPEGATQNPEPRTLNQNLERGTGNAERLDVAPQSVSAERSTKTAPKADATAGQPAFNVRAGLVAAAGDARESGDAPDRSHRPEPHLTFARPVAADVQTLGAMAMSSANHELLSARMAPASQPAVVVAPAPANGAALPEETANQIVQAIRFQLTRGGGEATIRLEPKHFGEVSITVRVEQGQVTARLQAESPVVREYLQSHQGLLRDSLADQQLTLGKFEVAEPPAESRDAERRSAEERAFQGDRQAEQRRRQQSPNTPFEPFEVVA